MNTFVAFVTSGVLSALGFLFAVIVGFAIQDKEARNVVKVFSVVSWLCLLMSVLVGRMA